MNEEEELVFTEAELLEARRAAEVVGRQAEEDVFTRPKIQRLIGRGLDVTTRKIRVGEALDLWFADMVAIEDAFGTVQRVKGYRLTQRGRDKVDAAGNVRKLFDLL